MQKLLWADSAFPGPPTSRGGTTWGPSHHLWGPFFRTSGLSVASSAEKEKKGREHTPTKLRQWDCTSSHAHPLWKRYVRIGTLYGHVYARWAVRVAVRYPTRRECQGSCIQLPWESAMLLLTFCVVAYESSCGSDVLPSPSWIATGPATTTPSTTSPTLISYLFYANALDSMKVTKWRTGIALRSPVESLDPDPFVLRITM